MKAIVFKKRYWKEVLWPRIIADNGQGVMISWVCKERLGFTVREHQLPYDEDNWWETSTEIHLDFYDEQMRTLFLLKYYDQN